MKIKIPIPSKVASLQKEDEFQESFWNVQGVTLKLTLG